MDQRVDTGIPVEAREKSVRQPRRWIIVGIGLALLSLGILGLAALAGVLPLPVPGEKRLSAKDNVRTSDSTLVVPVKVVQPRQDPSVQLTVEQLAVVEAYYRADLRARASGLVKAVYKDIGDHVVRGELLIDIDVPDQIQEVAQKGATVEQRRQELRVSRAHLKDAEAGREVARAMIREKQALVVQAEATRDFRKKRLERLRKLAATDLVVAGVIDEEERDFAASEAVVTAAMAAVERSRADANEADSKVEAASADIDLKAANVDVARRDLDRAKAVAEYARVTAPFDGVVVRRNVDPGSFVQNATTGQSELLISVSRSDLVTVVARFPDSAAPFVTDGTEAEITFGSLPGLAVNAKVTRFSPSIQNSDRTMRVEVDLFNGSEKDHARIMGRLLSASLAPLVMSEPFGVSVAGLAGRDALSGLHKGDGDLYAVTALGPATSQSAGRFIPGMTGTMKLVLRYYHGGYVLPSTAVYSRSGKSYILVVENGVTRQLPVQVQVNDGRVVKVVSQTRKRDAAGVFHEEVTELTGKELVVISRQLEVGEAVNVRPVPGDW